MKKRKPRFKAYEGEYELKRKVNRYNLLIKKYEEILLEGRPSRSENPVFKGLKGFLSDNWVINPKWKKGK